VAIITRFGRRVAVPATARVHGFARWTTLTAAGLLLAALPGGALGATRGGRAAHQAQLAAQRTTVQTMPPIPGAVFRLPDGTALTTDSSGKVQVPTLVLGHFQGKNGPAGLSAPKRISLPGGGYALSTEWWGTNGGKRPMTLGFNVFRPFTLGFVRPVSQLDPKAGIKPIPASQIATVAIKSSVGGLTRLVGSQVGRSNLYWVEHVVSRQGGPYVSPIQYRLKAVYISGTNVVTSLKQSFCPYYTQDPNGTRCLNEPDPKNRSGVFRLIFYQANFTVSDTIIPHSIGQGVILKFPDGTSKEYAFTSPGHVMISALPRGKYTVSVDAPGFGFSRPLTLTRDQNVDLKVISYLDLAIIGTVFTAIVLGLLVARRPHLIGLKRKS